MLLYLSQQSTEVGQIRLTSIAVNGGVLNSRYSRNQFDVCAKPLFTITGISTDKSTSLRCLVKRESNCGGQGFCEM